MEEFIRFPCPACGKSVKATPDQVGKRVRCPKRSCAHVMYVPEAVPAAPAETSRSPWPWMVGGVIGVLLVLLIAGAAWFLMRGKGPAKPGPHPVDQVASTSAADKAGAQAPKQTKQAEPGGSSFPPPPPVGDAPKLWHVELVEFKKDSNSMEFAVALLAGKAPVVGKKATLWFTLGTPTTIESVRSSLESDLKEDRNRFFLNFYGPGFIAIPCRDARVMDDKKQHWQATVNFGKLNLQDDTLDVRGSTFPTTELPMSFVFWDDEYNLSNELKFLVNARTGKVVKVLSGEERAPEPGATALPGKKGPRVSYLDGGARSIQISDIYVDTTVPLKTPKPARLPTSFPSGTKSLNIMVEFGSSPPASIDWKCDIRSSKGRIDTTPKNKEPVATSMYIDHNRTLCLFMTPTAGMFPDGPYQATITINGKEHAVLNWSVGD